MEKHMVKLHRIAASLFLCGLLTAPALAPAQTASPSTAPQAASAAPMKTIGMPSKQKSSESLIVLNSTGAKLMGQTLVLEGTSPSAILFTDRPVRGAGHIATREVVDLWSSGSFAKDPPNATISAFAKDGSPVRDAVVILTKPKLEGDKLTFEVTVMEGDLGKADGPAAIFIDTIWFGVGSGGVSYLGQNQTSGGTTPNIGNASTMSGWSNPAPDGAYRRSWSDSGYGYGQPPPDWSARPAPAQCGSPPLLPCY
jgi:hypothetical protein